ncbi:MAG: YjbQ family protein [Chloroflexi bacterium]|nr:YjbQ family protein [Chloroflexota bacterium]
MTAPQAAGGVLAAPFQWQRAASPFEFIQEHLEYVTEPGPSFRDITEDVQRVVDASGMRFGQVTIFSMHTTAAIRLQEHEPLLLEDLKDLLRRMAPPDRYYRHNDFSIRTVNMHPNEPENGHSHCQHLLLSTSETVPLVDGGLHLGEWQSIFLVELDDSRRRRVAINIIGARGE